MSVENISEIRADAQNDATRECIFRLCSSEDPRYRIGFPYAIVVGFLIRAFKGANLTIDEEVRGTTQFTPAGMLSCCSRILVLIQHYF